MTTMQKMLSLFFLLAMLLIAIFYYLFLSPLVLSYQNSNIRLTKANAAFAEYENNRRVHIHFAHALLQWKQAHPALYAAKMHPLTQNTFLQYLIGSAEQSDYLVVSATPIIHKTQSHFLLIQLSLHGSYRSLFFFIQQLMHSAYPITVIRITTSTINLYELTLELDENNT